MEPANKAAAVQVAALTPATSAQISENDTPLSLPPSLRKQDSGTFLLPRSDLVLLCLHVLEPSILQAAVLSHSLRSTLTLRGILGSGRDLHMLAVLTTYCILFHTERDTGTV